MIDRLDDVLDDLRQGVRIPEVSKGWALDIDVEQPSDGMVAFILEHADRSRNRAERVPIGFRLDGAVNRERNVRLLLATNYLICLAMLVFVVVILLVGDRYPRVNGSEWRVKPTRSGKTWILYRWEGWNEMRINKRFKTRQQAEEFARSVLLSVQSKAFSAPVSEPAQVVPAAQVPPTTSRHEQEVARATVLAAETWDKASSSIMLTNSSSIYPIRISNLRLSKYYLDQVRRLKKSPGILIDIDTTEFESRLSSSALAILKFGGFSNAISQVKEGLIGPLPPEVKVSVWSRDGGACIRCGAVDQLRFDPDYSGFSNDYEGAHLQLVCDPCFSKKSAWRKG